MFCGEDLSPHKQNISFHLKQLIHAKFTQDNLLCNFIHITKDKLSKLQGLVRNFKKYNEHKEDNFF